MCDPRVEIILRDEPSQDHIEMADLRIGLLKHHVCVVVVGSLDFLSFVDLLRAPQLQVNRSIFSPRQLAYRQASSSPLERPTLFRLFVDLHRRASLPEA